MSAGRGPLNGHTAEQWRRARARAARRHHPDMGGDVETYLDALLAVDAQFGVGAFGTARVQVLRDRSPRARLAQTLGRARRTARHVTARIPTRWRRGPDYIDL